jgi:dihydroorotase (multifunctional complex type)
MPEFDLGVEGGVVVSGRGRRRANVYIVDGRVAEVTEERRSARETADAADLLVMPGFVDAHVHFMDPADPSREDFPSGSAAAARAGVTTVIEHTHGRPVRTAADLAEKATYLADRSVVDFALGAHAWPGHSEDVGPAWRAGVAFIKAFTCTTHGIPGHDAAALFDLMTVAAESDATCLLHCEDESLTAGAEAHLRAAGRQDGGLIPEWRNRTAELVAVAVAALLARRTGARAVLAHASNTDVLDLAGSMTVESCPQYLTLMEAEAASEGAFRKFTPPARAGSPAALEAMWQALADGRIDYVSSDHAPSTRAQKSAGSIWDVPFGLPGIDTTSAVLLEGAHSGLITYERVVEVYAEAPARLYGLKRKGTLEPGADADISLVGPQAAWTVGDNDILSKAGWSPFAGRTLHGRPLRTYVRGNPVAAEGAVIAAPGTGRFVPGPGLA